jgi:hypothetical protein
MDLKMFFLLDAKPYRPDKTPVDLRCGGISEEVRLLSPFTGARPITCRIV